MKEEEEEVYELEQDFTFSHNRAVGWAGKQTGIKNQRFQMDIEQRLECKSYLQCRSEPSFAL